MASHQQYPTLYSAIPTSPTILRPNCVLRSRSWFQKDLKHLSCQSNRLSYFEPLSLQIYPLTPALSQFLFLSFPLFLLFKSITFLSFAFPWFPPSSLPPSPPVSIKLPFPVPLRTRGRVVYLGVAPPAIDSSDMNNTLLTKLHHSAHRPETSCFYFCEFS